MSPITSHVLDTAPRQARQWGRHRLETGKGADRWVELARGVTDRDGRVGQFTPDLKPLVPGLYRLRFLTAAYFTSRGNSRFLSRDRCDRPGRRPRPTLSHPPTREPVWLHHLSRQLTV